MLSNLQTHRGHHGRRGCEFPYTLVDGRPTSSQFARGSLLPARTKFFGSARRTLTMSAALKRLGDIHEQGGLERVGEFPKPTAGAQRLGYRHRVWLVYFSAVPKQRNTGGRA